MKKRVAVCAALGVLAMQGGSAYAGIDEDYPITGGGGGVPPCEQDGGGAGGTDGGGADGGGADGCFTPVNPGNPVPAISSRAPAPQQALPETGTDSGDVLRIGGVSVAAGLGLLAVTRRRRQTVVS